MLFEELHVARDIGNLSTLNEKINLHILQIATDFLCSAAEHAANGIQFLTAVEREYEAYV